MSVGTTAAATALTTTVAREYVHKAAHSEVLLTGWRRVDQDRFVVTAQWPRDHSFYSTVAGRHDPLLVAESVRQAIPLLSHVGYDVPFGHRQIWDRFVYAVEPAALTVGDTPTDIELHISCTDITRRGRRLAGLTMEVGIVRDGELLGGAEASFTNQPPAVYERLRGRYADLDEARAHALPTPPPMTPQLAGRDRSRDVVLAAGNRLSHTQLRADLTHPVLFDHPVDHAPGMLLLEAARQAAHAAAFPRTALISGVAAEFFRYAELDAPCWIETQVVPHVWDPEGRLQVKVTARQGEHVVFSATTTAEIAVEEFMGFAPAHAPAMHLRRAS
ncbi:ScbA/BarX family gamma-butyrolactone biosynthesis protein [Streptomyces bambusae]|uniref:Transcriptional regulator n=1 Tax=Streptomyces bambusae TaxID=1550616 RepID=A0ABS6ZEG5_9ACTN|nr:ScbA/BarX family gamma-butyrolactone biosynthesis protein [Streptomyces bambusae]MBW5485986.1 transcriptional regulator [Streptomyces bambusae]